MNFEMRDKNGVIKQNKMIHDTALASFEGLIQYLEGENGALVYC